MYIEIVAAPTVGIHRVNPAYSRRDTTRGSTPAAAYDTCRIRSELRGTSVRRYHAVRCAGASRPLCVTTFNEKYHRCRSITPFHPQCPGTLHSGDDQSPLWTSYHTQVEPYNLSRPTRPHHYTRDIQSTVTIVSDLVRKLQPVPGSIAGGTVRAAYTNTISLPKPHPCYNRIQSYRNGPAWSIAIITCSNRIFGYRGSAGCN